MIDYTDEALEQVRALRHHYETLARDAAIRALDRALADSAAKIESASGAGCPHHDPTHSLLGRVGHGLSRGATGLPTEPDRPR